MGNRRIEYDDDSARPRPRRRGFRCPYCGTPEFPVRVSKVSTGGWIVFVAMLFFCLPLYWVGLFITEEHQECYECGTRLGG